MQSSSASLSLFSCKGIGLGRGPPRRLHFSLTGDYRIFFFSSRRRHTRFKCDWSSDVCSSDLKGWSAENMFPQSMSDVEFMNCKDGDGGNYKLRSTSPYKYMGTDGKDLGADIVRLNQALANVE